tara:strand:+ start:922 stop:1206 length:285 start_codon:yes stop_codon:yes gene_type:complete
MKIQIQAIHLNLNSDLELFIDKKIKRLQNIDDNIISAEVFLKLSKADSHNNKIVEIKINSSSDFFAKKQSNSFEESVDLVCQALRKQIIKNKNK